MAYVRATVLASVVLALCACSGLPGTASQASSSPTPPVSTPPGASPSSPAFPSPSPGGPTPPAPLGVTCPYRIPRVANLVLVTLRNTTGVIVRDISDLSNPISRCTLHGTGGGYFRFMDWSHVSYIVTNANGTGALYLTDLLTRRTSLVRVWSDEDTMYWVYAWSPDAKTLSYVSSNSAGVTWHVLSAAGDVTLSSFGPIPGRGINPDSDDAMTGFSADGQYVALEHTFSGPDATTAPFQIVRLSDHKLVYSRKDGTMATWAGAGARLFFRTIAGVESWNPKSGVQVVVPGLAWIHPRPSADGLRIVYTAADGTGNHHAGYLRLTDQPLVGNVLTFQPRIGAAFLNSTLVWYAEESACAQMSCGLGGPPLTGRTFLRDLVTGTERSSIDTTVFDSWPHVGAA
jgi:hypothetical protein